MKRPRRSTSAASPAKSGRWPQRAAALATALPRAGLHVDALAVIEAASASTLERVAIACSGGADSVAIVLALWAHLPALRGRWLILHFDHRLRGAASTADARFVAALARGLGERCVVERWDKVGRGLRPGRESPPAPRGVSAGVSGKTFAKAGGLDPKGARADAVSEAEAREARFSFFRQAMGEAGARVLVLGHQADDVIETMLMRLARGSGTGGLAAPRPVHAHRDGTLRVRPLLAWGCAEIRACLRRAGVPWREDATNATDVYVRNRIRRRVVPALQAAVGRALAPGFLAARAAMDEDDAALDQWLVECAGPAESREWTRLTGRPRALARRAVHLWLVQHGLAEHVNRSAAEAVVDAVWQGRAYRTSAGSRQLVVFDGRQLSLATDHDPGTTRRWPAEGWLDVGGELEGPGGARIRAELLELTPARRRALFSGAISAERCVLLNTPLRRFHIRVRQPGDRYRPLGAPGRARLQDLLVNRKIPRGLRDQLPVVCGAGDEPVWVPGLPSADELAVRRGTKLVVQLTYTPSIAIVPSP